MEVDLEDTSEMEVVNVNAMRTYENTYELRVNHECIDPGSTIHFGDLEKNNKTLQEDTDVAEFKNKMVLLSKMEAKSAQAFLNRGIHRDFKWPSENETKEENQVRKQLNTKKLKAATKRSLRKTNDEELRKLQREKDADRKRLYRNPDNQELNISRHAAHAEEQRQYRNPEDQELNRSRHAAHAEEQRHYRNPEDQELSLSRHAAHADVQRRYIHKINNQ